MASRAKPMPRKSARTRAQSTGRRLRRNGAGDRSKIVVSAEDRAAGRWFAKLVALQHRLCAPGGCPWDREQTHASLRKYLIEETYEVLDAMESGDSAEFASELGDLLLQIVFHSVLAENADGFTISDVIEAIFTKMVRRHPHVFGTATASTSSAVLKNWEEIKAEERAAKRNGAKQGPAHESILSGVPRSLPGVLEAYQLTRRASRIGFDWDNLNGIFDKIDEERRELSESIAQDNGMDSATLAAKEEEVGDMLFAAVNVARFVGVDPEIALKKANRKFKKRFQWMETAGNRDGTKFTDLPRERMEELWIEAKAALKIQHVRPRSA